MITRSVRPLVLLSSTALTVALAAGCTQNSPTGAASASSDSAGVVSVISTDSTCEVSSASVPAGRITFNVENRGTDVTEFYLLAADGQRILSEAENISPGLTRSLVLTAPEGSYFTACKPGMTGDGIRAGFIVTAAAGTVAPVTANSEQVEQATARYAAYVRTEADQLLVQTREFATLYKAGADDRARALYPEARTHWERMEPVAESFGDLDPRMDAREADLAPGTAWTGWHAIEKDLWPPKTGDHAAFTPAQRAEQADRLVADTEELHARTRDITFTLDQIGNGAKSLLDEVATGKVTGEEEIWSHTDLWDFQANVDGAKEAYDGLHPLLQQRDPQLDREIAARFGELQALLDSHRSGQGFVSYDALSTEQVKTLSDAVNALSEPLSRMTGAVV